MLHFRSAFTDDFKFVFFLCQHNKSIILIFILAPCQERYLKKSNGIYFVSLYRSFLSQPAHFNFWVIFSVEWYCPRLSPTHPTHQNTEIMSQATFKCCTRVFTHKNRIHKLNIERLGYTYKCKSCSHQFFTLIKIHINNPIYFCFTKNPLRVHKWLMAVVSGTPLVHSMLPLPNSSEGRQVLP